MTRKQLRAARAKLGLTQAQLGARLNVDMRTIRKWEAGDRKIPGAVVLAMKYLAEHV